MIIRRVRFAPFGDTCVWSANEIVIPALCAATSQCQYMVYMTDSYGDGWNGN